MKREQLLKHWSVIEAFRNGKQIQVKNTANGRWMDNTEPDFFLAWEYRVKPEKKELWLNLYKDYNSGVSPSRGYNSKAEADSKAADNRVACVKVVYEEGEGL